MKRRSFAHNYSRPGYYHITISANNAYRQPFGFIAGQLDKADGDADAPHVVLSAVGQMVEEELLTSISLHYPMIEVLDHIVMPEHLHFILDVRGRVASKSGRSTHLGRVIAGFKYGCNKRFLQMLDAATLATKSPDTVLGSSVAHPSPSVLGDSVAKQPPLFEAGYCDVIPFDNAQLETQRAYIRNNPRSRLLRTTFHADLYPQRLTIDTAVTLPALRGYLQRECPRDLTADSFAMLQQRLLQHNGHIFCDSFGPQELLRHRLLPVVCHRKDKYLFPQQKAHCLAEAAAGAVLVSARIAKGEQEIMDAAAQAGYPVIRIEDNGFPEIYHPSSERTEACASGKLLILTPWTYQFRKHDDPITVPFCKTMNCVSQAVCRMKDSWWKEG